MLFLSRSKRKLHVLVRKLVILTFNIRIHLSRFCFLDLSYIRTHCAFFVNLIIAHPNISLIFIADILLNVLIASVIRYPLGRFHLWNTRFILILISVIAIVASLNTFLGLLYNLLLFNLILIHCGYLSLCLFDWDSDFRTSIFILFLWLIYLFFSLIGLKLFMPKLSSLNSPQLISFLC